MTQGNRVPGKTGITLQGRPAGLMLERGLFFLITVGAVLVYFYVVFPALRGIIQPHHCMLTEITGLLCPACGGTRAAEHLLAGRFGPALRSNLLIILVPPLFLYIYWISFRLAFDRSFRAVQFRIAPVWLWGLLAIILLFWILRNLPYFFFLRPM